jgi:alpha-tubulin suppressor-like RCC1 family protein
MAEITARVKRKTPKYQTFIWGRGSDGQLGLKDQFDHNLPAVLACFNNKIVSQVACGGRHSLAVTSSGDVYSWGWNWSGQLGTGEASDKDEPHLLKQCVLIKALHSRRFVLAAAGSDHSLLLREDGAVYACGGNHDGQLGLGDNKLKFQFSLKLVTALHGHHVIQLASGGGHVLALTKDGKVFSWGRDANGRLGLDDDDTLTPVNSTTAPLTPRKSPNKSPKQAKPSNQFRPVLISALQHVTVTHVTCGWNHSMALTSTGEVYAWGNGSDGKLGLGDEQDRSTPTLLPYFAQERIPVQNITAGYYHSSAIDEFGNVYTWGWGEHGQLGHGEPVSELQPRLVAALVGQHVTQMSCGGFHSACVTVRGELYTWGLSDYGQLGLGDVSSVSDKQRILLPAPVTALADLHAEAVACGWWQTCVTTRVKETGNESLPKVDLENEGVAPYLEDFNKFMSDDVLTGTEDVSDDEISAESSDAWDDTMQDYIASISSYKPAHLTAFDRQLESLKEKIDLDETAFDSSGEEDSASVGHESNNSDWQSDTSDTPSIFGQTRHSSLPTTPVRSKKVNAGSVHSTPLKRQTSALQSVGLFLANIFFDQKKRQRTVDINRTQRLERQHSREVDRVTRMESQLDHTSRVWLEQILPNWEKKKRQRSTKLMWRAGIPPTVRGQVWMTAIGNTLQLSRAEYLRLIEINSRKHLSNSPGLGQSPSKLIEIDVPRTFPATSLFKEEGPFYAQLNELLQLYALYNPELGYVQGMSYLAGMLLIYMEPYEAFVSFANLLNSHYFASLFAMNVDEILKHLKIYDLLFAKILREVHAHFAALSVSPESYLLDWFMTLFSRALPFDAASRLWDCYLIEGEVFLFRAALALLHLHRKSLKQGEFEEVMHTLRDIGREVNVNELISAIESLKAPSYIVEFVKQLNQEGTGTVPPEHNNTNAPVPESAALLIVNTSEAQSSALVPPRVVNLLGDFM